VHIYISKLPIHLKFRNAQTRSYYISLCIARSRTPLSVETSGAANSSSILLFAQETRQVSEPCGVRRDLRRMPFDAPIEHEVLKETAPATNSACEIDEGARPHVTVGDPFSQVSLRDSPWSRRLRQLGPVS